jgi:polyhydroxybutyrate depolymerase
MLRYREWSCACKRLRCSAIVALLGGAVAGCGPSPDAVEGMQIASFDYASAARHGSCEPGTRAGHAGATDGLKSSLGVRYNVRAPSNYDATVAHPLLMVYAPAGRSAGANEAFTYLTRLGTENGFVVAYAASQSMSVETVQTLAKLPKEIAEQWCIDLGQVYATGHSDGGTVSTAIALLDDTRGMVAGIAPSAAGFARSDFDTFHCPAAPLPVMVMHGRDDLLFHGWGAEAAKWWAGCNGCDLAQPPVEAGGECVAYQACRDGAPTLYCEGPRSHAEWPGLGAEIVRFFRSAEAKTSSRQADSKLAGDGAATMCRKPRDHAVAHSNALAEIEPAP